MPDSVPTSRPAAADADVYRSAADTARLVAEHAQPFERAPDADAFLDRTAGARVVCLGEATHGTDEFYRVRAELTRALVERGGVRVVAVEADWPDAERVDAYVRHRDPGEHEWQAFGRFPSWMWRNEPVRDFVEWLRDWNAGRPEHDRAGFFGLDLYSLYTSIGQVLAYLDARDPELAADARRRYGCLMPFEGEPADYGRALARSRYDDCRDEVTEMLRGLLQKRIARTAQAQDRAADGPVGHGGDFPYFDAVQNARLVRDAEAYYRESFLGGANTWNLRDTHMTETLRALLDYFGEGSRAAVWAHNSHLGDAAATAMGARGEVNVGHLSRRIWGDGAYLVGFGTHAGTVLAADDWGGPGRVQTVRPSHPESVERVGHETGVPRFALPLRGADAALRDELARPRLERAIGVIYRPQTELQSHYFPAQLSRQFDEWVWIDQTTALVPLGAGAAPGLPHAHPFGLLGD